MKLHPELAPEAVTSRLPTLEYRPAIDGLRAIAVLAVFLFHLDRRSLPGGFVGVDVFFVISGYLITSIIFYDCERGRFSFGRFYQRRIARLLPAFFVVATVTLLAASRVYSKQDLASAGANLSASAASFENFKLMFQGSYFTLSPDAQPFLHCWSLSVEEQFYLLFPACFLLLYKTARRHRTRIFIALWVLSFLLCIVLTYKKPDWAFYLPLTRAWELLTGSLLVDLANRRSQKRALSASAFSVLGLLAVAVSFFIISENRAFPGYLAALPVLGTAVLLVGVETTHPLIERTLSWGPLVAVGRGSYSLYLWHWPIFSLVDYRWFLASPAFRIGLKVGLSIVAAAISYLWIERPCRSALNNPARRRLAFTALVFSLAILVPLGIETRRTNYPAATASDVAHGGLHFNGSARDGSMILMGDSNGAMYASMAIELAKERGLKINVISVPAEDPLPHSSGEVSPLWLSSLKIVEREKPSFLVLACKWNKLEEDEGRLEAALHALSLCVGRIIVLTQPPGLPVAATRENIRKGVRPPFFEDPGEQPRRLHLNGIVRRAKGAKVSIVDVEPLFFKNGRELLFFDPYGKQLYQDRDHLSDAGAQLVKTELLRAMTNSSSWEER